MTNPSSSATPPENAAIQAQTESPVRVVLASQSPRRRELLSLIGVTHTVMPADIDESTHVGELPEPHAERLARTKARVIAERETGALVIGSDTIVVIDNTILGKPVDEADAARMLRLLSGRTHTVVTAVAAARDGVVVSAVERVTVQVRGLTDDMIANYIATREPMDKAGSYGIQGFGATLIERIDGDYFAVMGLPIARLIGLCEQLGVHYRFGPLSASSRAAL